MLSPHLPPNQLLVLAYLLKTRSVSTTALMLGMSQPSVSRALARLREVLKDPLLVRSGNQMARTWRGEELVDRLTDWVAATTSLLDEADFDPARLERRFRIATTDFGVQSACLPAMARLRASAPSLALDLQPLGHASHRQLAHGEIDLAISGLDHDPEQVHRELLFTDHFVCVTRKDHPLARHGDAPVPLGDFLAHPHLGLTVSDAELDRVSTALGEAVRHRKVMLSVPYFALAPDLLLAGDLVTVVPSRLVHACPRRDELAILGAPEGLGPFPYWLLWHERSRNDPGSIWLREQLLTANAEPPPTIEPRVRTEK